MTPPSIPSMRRLAVLITISLTSFLASCKQECGTPLTVEKFIEASESHTWELTCEAMWTCPREHPITELFVGTYPSLEACKADLPIRFTQGTPQILAGLRAGRMRFEPKSARRCLKWWKAQTAHDMCRRDFDRSVCEGVFVGQVSRGERCVLDGECAGDLECSGAQPGNGDASDCYGTCRVPKDRRCGNATCELEEYCDREEPGGALLCKPRVGAGGPCVSKNGCSRASGTHCNRRRDDRDEHGRMRGVCIAPHSLDGGEECESNIFCKSGLHCIDSTCQSLPPLRKEGEACDGEKRLCGPGLICFKPDNSEAERSCVRPRTEGEPCRPTHQCEPHLTCDAKSDGTGTCTPRRVVGEPCDTPWLCKSFHCEDGRCIAPQVCEIPDSTE